MCLRRGQLVRILRRLDWYSGGGGLVSDCAWGWSGRGGCNARQSRASTPLHGDEAIGVGWSVEIGPILGSPLRLGWGLGACLHAIAVTVGAGELAAIACKHAPTLG
jgi:hypothetical protein